MTAIERNPRDSRLRYTKECLYGSFLELLAEKPVNDITVIEICEKAGVSRKTFYKYYSDQFALLVAMQDDLFEDYRHQLEGQPAEVSQIMPVLIRFVDENRVLVRAAFANQGEGNFVDRVLDDLYATYREAWGQANPALSEADVEFLFYFAVSGLFGIVRRWLFEHPELTAETVISQAAALMHVADPHRAAPYPQ
ncbi:MAG: TetR/AcrR family transcriptional regulator C-terminal domain-containing protein [Eggerthellaceae bacterium]|nr:TetR/AcrR family transcriptional regulator C-terminal domain-containing protein [Eggerthellaceae bacterium]